MAKFEVGRIYKGSPHNYPFMCLHISPNYVWLWDIAYLIPDKVIKRKINTNSKKSEWSYGTTDKEIVSAERLGNPADYEHYLKFDMYNKTVPKRVKEKINTYAPIIDSNGKFNKNIVW